MIGIQQDQAILPGVDLSRELLATMPGWVIETLLEVIITLGEQSSADMIRDFIAIKSQQQHHGSWLNSFPPESGASENSRTPEHADCTSLDIDKLTATLSSGGALSNYMQGYESRSGQLKMLQTVAIAFNSGKHLIVEAGTGVGKSLAYLVPAAYWSLWNDVPVVISTNTRNLQTQLFKKDLPLVEMILQSEAGEESNFKLRTALLKGRTNYLCLRFFGTILENWVQEVERHELRDFASTLLWAAHTSDGDLDTLYLSSSGVDSFFSRLSCSGEECPGRMCRYFSRCFLHKARARAAAAHLIITNHALVFSEIQTPGSILPLHNQIIFDEAHNLESVATQHLSVEITFSRLNRILRRIIRNRGKVPAAGGILETLLRQLEQGGASASPQALTLVRQQADLIREGIDTVRVAARMFFETFFQLSDKNGETLRYRNNAAVNHTPGAPVTVAYDICLDGKFQGCDKLWQQSAEQVYQTLRQELVALGSAMGTMSEIVRKLADDELSLQEDNCIALERCAGSVADFVHDLDFTVSATENHYVFWIEGMSRSGMATLKAAPLSVADLLTELLFDTKVSVILCSATLRVGSSFNYLGRRLGIDLSDQERVITCVAESPFNYMEQCVAVVPVYLPEPTNPSADLYVRELATLMHELFVCTQGRAMGLFTSYEMMNQVGALLEQSMDKAGISLLVQGSSGSRDQILERFRSVGATVLLGTHSFWEGVDVVGDALSCVIMARLPFTAINEPVFAARCEQIDAAGGNSFRELSLPQAVIRFRQGFGRLIRSQSDRGVVVIADARIMSKSYGSVFKNSLPLTVTRVSGFSELGEIIKGRLKNKVTTR